MSRPPQDHSQPTAQSAPDTSDLRRDEPRPDEPRPPQVTNLGPWWVTAGGLTLALVALWLGRVHLFAAFLVLTLVAMLGLRLTLPPSRAGGLVVRGRSVDMALLVLLSVLVGAAAAVLKLNPAGAP